MRNLQLQNKFKRKQGNRVDPSFLAKRKVNTSSFSSTTPLLLSGRATPNTKTTHRKLCIELQLDFRCLHLRRRIILCWSCQLEGYSWRASKCTTGWADTSKVCAANNLIFYFSRQSRWLVSSSPLLLVMAGWLCNMLLFLMSGSHPPFSAPNAKCRIHSNYLHTRTSLLT